VSLRQFNIVLAGDAGAKALTGLLVLCLVRLLQPRDFAAYVFLSSLVILSATLLSGFFNRHYIMTEAADSAARMYRALQVAASASVFIAAALFLGAGTESAPLAAGFVCTVAAAAYDFRRTHAQKVQAFAAWSKADVLRAFVLMVLSLPLANLLQGPELVTGLLGAQAFAFGCAAYALPVLPTASPQKKMPRLADRGALALVGYFALVGVFGQLPILALKQIADTDTLASFGSAFRYYGLLLGVVAAASVVILPRVAQTKDLAATLRSLGAVLGVAGGLGLTAAVMGYFAIPVVDGGKYPDAPLLFALLCTGLIPGLVLAPLTAVFMRTDDQLHLLASQVAAVAVATATAWGFREHGAFAAAICVPAGVLAQLVWLVSIAHCRWRVAS
jgi:hypothetical protein